MRAGQQGPQLSARVFLNHDLVTDCASVHKGMCSFSTRWRSAFSLWGRQSGLGRLFVRDSWPLCTVTGPAGQLGSRGCEDGHISFTLADATHFYCRLSIFKPQVYQLACRTYVSGKHMSLPTHTHTLPLSLSVCMQRGMCAYECVRDKEFGWYEQLQIWGLFCFGSDFFFFFCLQKSH